MPVYRTYVDASDLTEVDAQTITAAIGKARVAALGVDPSVFDFIDTVASGRGDAGYGEAAARIQQYSGPVMAKGLEDTALYRFNRLIALSDVGEKPDRFSRGIDAFHRFMKDRLRDQPNGMLSSSSHDTKRGEDVRARIAALSGQPEAWDRAVKHWSSLLLRERAAAIEANDEYYFFQLLLGAWPASFASDRPLETAALDEFRGRMEAAMLKSVREARVRTNWNAPRETYEKSVADFVRHALTPRSGESFLTAFRAYEDRVAADGAANGLMATVLKLTVPGVPDLYQGAELWEQSMVDPDNRRPVDFAAREAALGSVEGCDLSQLGSDFRSGRIKLAVIARLLALRARVPDLFASGNYEPTEAEGPDSRRILAFTRRHGRKELFVAMALGPWLGAPDATIAPAHLWGTPEVLRAVPISSEGLMHALAGGLPAAVLFRE